MDENDRPVNPQPDELEEYMMKLEDMGIIRGFSEWLHGEEKDGRSDLQAAGDRCD